MYKQSEDKIDKILDMLTLVKNLRANKLLISHSMMTSQIKALIKNTKPFIINIDDSESDVSLEESIASDNPDK